MEEQDKKKVSWFKRLKEKNWKEFFRRLAQRVQHVVLQKWFRYALLVLIVFFCFFALNLGVNWVILIALACLFLWFMRYTRHLLNWGIFVAVLFVLTISLDELTRSAVVIEKIDVPEDFLKQNPGYSGAVLSSHMYDRLQQMNRIKDIQTPNQKGEELEANRFNYSVFNDSSSPEFYFQQFGISLDAFYHYIRRQGYFKRWLKYEYYLCDGDLVYSQEEKKWKLTLRVDDGDHKTSRVFTWENEKTIDDAASFVLQNVDLYQFAIYYQSQNDYHSILYACTSLLEEGRSTAQIWNTLGSAQASLMDLNSAMFSFQQALNIDPKFTKAYLNLSALAFNTTNWDLAVKSLQSLLQVEETNLIAHYWLAKIYVKTGKLDMALKELNRAAKISPNTPEFHYQLSSIYRLLGDYKRSQKEYQLFEKAVRKSPEVIRFKINVNNITNTNNGGTNGI